MQVFVDKKCVKGVSYKRLEQDIEMVNFKS